MVTYNHNQRTFFSMADDPNERVALRKCDTYSKSVDASDSTSTTTTTVSNSSCSSQSNDQKSNRSICSISASQKKSQYKPKRLHQWQRNAIRSGAAFVERDLQYVISESTFLQTYSQEKNETIPVFHRSEIRIGSLLGEGGFSNVYEIIGFQLDERVSRSLSNCQQAMRVETATKAVDPISKMGRFAIKQLQERLIQCEDTINEFHFAASDLAVEAAFLSALDHPNILPIRGLPFRGVKAFVDGQIDSFFMICDRLHDTLDDRISNQWKCTSSTPPLVKKTGYALQLAAALEYLHQNRIIFRDLKPQNIGFSVDNTDRLILFDFGLCRELPHPIDYTVDETFEMSGVGTRRYMAPEVVTCGRFNHKADVYSWSMVYFEILTHTKPYSKYTLEEHSQIVCSGGERPHLDKTEWSYQIQHLLESSWNGSISERLSMTQVCNMLISMVHESFDCVPVNNLFISESSKGFDYEGLEQIAQEHALLCLPGFINSINCSLPSVSSSVSIVSSSSRISDASDTSAIVECQRKMNTGTSNNMTDGTLIKELSFTSEGIEVQLASASDRIII